MSEKSSVVKIILLILSIASNQEFVTTSPAERRLLKHLFDNYDRRMRPSASDDEPVTVSLNMKIFQLIAVNEKQQNLEMSIWFRQKWKDQELSWNSSEFNNIKELHVLPDEVWLPDIVHYNNLHDDNAEYGGNLDTLKTRVIIYSTGDVYWLAPLLVKARCAIDVKDFPFDTQHCIFKFGSWTYDKSLLDLQTTGVEAGYPPNLEWNITRAWGVRSEKEYGCCPDVFFPDVTFHFEIQRRSLFYVLNLIFPITLITLLTTLAFLLPSESGERLSLAVTLMLASTVFMLLVAETTPESSDSVPVVTVYFMVCMVTMFVIIVVLCYLSRLHNVKRYDRPMDRWTRSIIFDKLSYILRIRYDTDQNRQHHKQQDQQRRVVWNGSLDCVPAIETLQSNGDLSHGESKTSKGNSFRNRYFIENKDDSSSSNINALKRFAQTSNLTEEEMIQLNTLIKNFENEQETKRRREERGMAEKEGTGSDYTFEEEWDIVASTIDRCLFILFLFIIVLGTIGCFGGTQYTT